MDIQVLTPFSSSGILFQDFGHFIVAAPGILAMLPWQSCEGKFPPVVEGCPVHFSEVALVLNTMADKTLETHQEQFNKKYLRQLWRIDSCSWRYVWLLELKAWVFVHMDSGLRVAFASELLLKKSNEHAQ